MGFEWDEDKNQSNIERHGIDFIDAMEIFKQSRLTSIDRRRDYGETRKISIGKIYNVVCVVVFTIRNDNIRIISARKANFNERRKYYEIVRRRKNK